MRIRNHAVMPCALLALIACEAGHSGAHGVDKEAGTDQQSSGEETEGDTVHGESDQDTSSEPTGSGTDEGSPDDPSMPSELPEEPLPESALADAPGAMDIPGAPRGVYWLAFHAGRSVEVPELSNPEDAFKIFYSEDKEEKTSASTGKKYSGMGRGGKQARTAVGFATWYMSETTGAKDKGGNAKNFGPEGEGWDYEPSELFKSYLSAAAAVGVPIVVHFNGTRYMEDRNGINCTVPKSPEETILVEKSLWCQFVKDHIANPGRSEIQVDQYGLPFVGDEIDENGVDKTGGMCRAGKCFLTLGRGPQFKTDLEGTIYRKYKSKNLKQAIRYLKAWAIEHPKLLIGITMDSETSMGAIGDRLPEGQTFPRIGDYSKMAIDEFRERMRDTWKGDIVAYVEKYGQCQQPALVNSEENPPTWEQVHPPKNTGILDVTKESKDPFNTPCWNNWQGIRVKMVSQMVNDTATWAISAGMPANRVWNHQSVNRELPFLWYEANPVDLAAVGPGLPGLDLYEHQLFASDGKGGMTWDTSIIDRAFGWDKYWAIAEFSAGLGSNANLGRAIVEMKGQNGEVVKSNGKCLPGMEGDIKERTYQTLMTAYSKNNRIAMPFMWNPAPWVEADDPSKTTVDGQSALYSWGISDCRPAIEAYREFIAAIDALPAL